MDVVFCGGQLRPAHLRVVELALTAVGGASGGLAGAWAAPGTASATLPGLPLGPLFWETGRFVE